MLSTIVFALIISLANCATIQWTGSGGTNLWDNPRNWDCGSCLPTLNDNVVIAFSLAPTFIRIGAPARAGSLTIGGSQTSFFQTLTVSGSLTIGSGTLNTNGALLIETGNNAPFNVTGVFTANGRGLSFGSGLLGGNGTLYVPNGAYMNFSGPAAKEISGNLKIDGQAQIVSGSGSSIFVRGGGSVAVNGALESRTGLELIVEPSASFTVSPQGSFTFNGPKLLLQGAVSLGKWTAPNAAITVINKLVSGSLTLGASSTLSLIGAPTEARSFQSVSGGTIKQEGGASTFQNIDVAGLALVGGTALFQGQSKIGQFAINGGTINGGSVNSASLSIDFGTIQGGASLSTSNLDLRGIVSLNGAGSTLAVAPSGQARVSAPSQITLGERTSFVISQGATMSQGAPLKLVSGVASGSLPSLNQNGAWTSSSNFTSLGVPVTGNGQFSLTSTAYFDFSNANFSTTSMSSQGSFAFQQGTFNLGTVTGSGRFAGSPAAFFATSVSASAFTLTDGNANIVKSNLASLQISNGQFNFGSAQIGTFDFQGGTFAGLPGQNAKATVNAFQVSKAPAKTISQCQLQFSNLNLQCPGGVGQCALFTVGSTLGTGNL